MESYLSKQQRSAEKGKDTTPVLAALAVVIIVMASCGLHGCANATVIKLADMCHTHDLKPNVTFSGESGKVDCH